MFAPHSIFHQALTNKIGKNESLSDYIDSNPDFYDTLMLVVGHFGFKNPLVQNASRRRIILANFRDPVERIVSLYNYMRFREDHALHQPLQKMTLYTAIRELPEFRIHCGNAQLRTIFGTDNLDRVRERLDSADYVVGRYGNTSVFLEAVEAISGFRRNVEIPHLNSEKPISGVLHAHQQNDYSLAVEHLHALNSSELEFFGRMPSVVISRSFHNLV
ncbi:hypothetical protein [Roseomonas fluvialis]|uniref:hypothetical protein n=1 Tax=Roseomonas fluvialis TaxID=1750527 RepID=UPI001FCB5C97